MLLLEIEWYVERNTFISPWIEEFFILAEILNHFFTTPRPRQKVTVEWITYMQQINVI